MQAVAYYASTHKLPISRSALHIQSLSFRIVWPLLGCLYLLGFSWVQNLNAVGYHSSVAVLVMPT